MTCPEADDRLDDYVDGALGEGEFQEVELHLASCEACREQERRTRSILAQARALPREVAPARDLWAGIAGRIEAGPRARPGWWLPAGLAAAAVLAAGLAVSVLRDGGPGTNAPPGDPPGLAPAAYEEALGGAERDYERAATALMGALQERRDRLSPETIASVERNLEVMDRALAEVRAALERDPGNKELTRMLVSTHRKKVDTLRRVVRLSTPLQGAGDGEEG